MSYNELTEYCIQNSYRSAKHFKAFGNNDNEEYTFWVATDGDNSKGQELYITYRAKLFKIDLSRVLILNQSSKLLNGIEKNVGMLYFTPRDEDGKKHPTNSIVFFSSNTAEKKMVRYSITYRITKNGETKEDTENCKIPKNQSFVIFANELGTIDNVKKDCIMATFYYEDGSVADEFMMETSEPTTR